MVMFFSAAAAKISSVTRAYASGWRVIVMGLVLAALATIYSMEEYDNLGHSDSLIDTWVLMVTSSKFRTRMKLFPIRQFIESIKFNLPITFLSFGMLESDHGNKMVGDDPWVLFIAIVS